MNFRNIGASLVQATNLVLLISNSNADIRKFIVWKKDDEKLTEVLQKAQIERIAIEDQAKIFEHPLETGAMITDHEIFEPKRVTCQMIISDDDAETLQELEQLYLSGAELRIRAGNKIITNVVISSKPFEISSEMFDKTRYSVTFKEALRVSPVYTKLPPRKVAKKSSASRVNSGVKQAKTVKKSWLASLTKGGRT